MFNQDIVGQRTSMAPCRNNLEVTSSCVVLCCKLRPACVKSTPPHTRRPLKQRLALAVSRQPQYTINMPPRPSLPFVWHTGIPRHTSRWVVSSPSYGTRPRQWCLPSVFSTNESTTGRSLALELREWCPVPVITHRHSVPGGTTAHTPHDTAP